MMHANGVRQREEPRGGLGLLVRQLWSQLRTALAGPRSLPIPPLAETTPPLAAAEPLRRFRLTDGVSRTLFEEYSRHRRGDTGEEETGWVLLGLRERDEA